MCELIDNFDQQLKKMSETNENNLKWMRKMRETTSPAGGRPHEPDAMFEQREFIYSIAKMNPLVPIGIVCMWGALFKGIAAFARGDSARSNRMMRYRVFFHALTLFAIVGGSALAASTVDYHSPSEDVPEWQKPKKD